MEFDDGFSGLPWLLLAPPGLSDVPLFSLRGWVWFDICWLQYASILITFRPPIVEHNSASAWFDQIAFRLLHIFSAWSNPTNPDIRLLSWTNWQMELTKEPAFCGCCRCCCWANASNHGSKINVDDSKTIDKEIMRYFNSKNSNIL